MLLCRNHVDVAQGVRRCSRCQIPYCSDCLVTIQGREYCAVCKNEQLLDVRSGTSQYSLPLASVGKRLAAQIIDNLAIFGGILLIVVPAILLGAFKGNDPSPAFVVLLIAVLFLGFIGYEALLLSRNGQTLGKMAMKIRVVRPDGSRISIGQAWGRAFARRLMISFLSIVNLVAGLVTQERTCLHDMLAKTRVVDAE